MNNQGTVSARLTLTTFLSKTKQRVYDTSQVLAYSLLLSHLTFIPYVHAGPTDGNVVAGTGSISYDGLSTVINQTSNAMVIDWGSYDVSSIENVLYLMDERAISLNNILSNNGSEIHGRIDAAGTLILVNPHGIFFGPTSQINVGGLIASGLTISTDDFLNGDYIFNEMVGADGVVINSGLINASLGGNVTLLGKQVINEGVINAHLGAVNMAAGKQAVLTFDNQGLIGVKISKEILQEELGLDPALINSGEINAGSGRVLLTASVSRDVFSQAVNIGELQPASSVLVNEDGSFSLGGGADVLNSGNINVSAANGKTNAGDVVVIGENVTHTGVIAANTDKGVAGNIELHANDTIELKDTALVTARAETAGTGGKVKVLGNKVGLFDTSAVDVSGANGGGEALIGGDRQGLNENIRNADFLFMDKQTSVTADALSHGDGGRIITYANDTGRFYGGLFARGGVEGGNGGFIETSGKRGFDILNAPDVSASAGEGGLWLIDPYNIIIQGSGDADTYKTEETTTETVYTSIDSINSTIDPTATSTISVTVIKTALLRGDVEIITDANDLGGENGDITFDAILDYDGTGSNSFTLNAAGDISFNNTTKIYDSSNSGDSLNVNLSAAGSIDLGVAVQIITQGGDFIVDANGGNTASSFITNANTIIDTAGNDNFDGGNISITTNGDITTGALTSNGGKVTADHNGTNAGSITLGAEGLVTVGGAISASGQNGVDQGGGTNNIEFWSGGKGADITLTSFGSNIILTSTVTSSGGNAAGDTGGNADGGNAGNIKFDALGADGTVSIAGNINSFYGEKFGTATDGTAGTITFNGNVLLTGDNILIDSNKDSFGSGNPSGAVTINGTINSDTISPRLLTIDSGNTNTIVTGAVGAVDALRGFTISESLNASVNAITTRDGGIKIITSDKINLGGSLDTTAGGATAGDLLLTGDIDLYADAITLNTNATNDKDIIITGDINADTDTATRSLTLDAGDKSVSLANVGELEALQGLSVTNSLVTTLNNAVRTKDGGVSITATDTTAGILLNGNITTNLGTDAGAVTLTGITLADASISINSNSSNGTDGNITFTNNINSSSDAFDLVLDAGTAAVDIQGYVGTNLINFQKFEVSNANSVSVGEIQAGDGGVSINTNGGTITLGGDVFTDNDASTAAISLNGDITLTSDVRFDTDIFGGSTDSSNITITGSIDSDTTPGGYALQFVADKGNVSITGAVGATAAVKSFTVTTSDTSSVQAIKTAGGVVDINATTSNLGGNIDTTNGGDSVAAAVTIDGSTYLTNHVAILTNSSVLTDPDAGVTFTGDINNDNSGNFYDLSIDAGTAAVALFDVGSTSAISSFKVTNSLTTTVGEIVTQGGDVLITATDTAADAIKLSGDITTSTATAAGNVTLTGTSIANSTVNINTNATDASGTDGNITFTNNILSSSTSDVFDLVLDAGTAAVDIQGNVGTANENFRKFEVTNANSVSVGEIQAGDGGVSINTNGGTITLGGNVETDNDASTAAISLNGDITLTSDVKFDAGKSGSETSDITITGSIDSDAAVGGHIVRFDADQGNVSITGAVGATAAVKSFTVTTSDTSSVQAIKTAGGVVDINATTSNLGGNIDTTNGGASVAAAVTIDGSTYLTNHVAILTNSSVLADPGADVTFTGDINNDNSGNFYDLSIDAGTATVALFDVGSTSAISSFKVTNSLTTTVGEIGTAGGLVSITASDVSDAIRLSGNINTNNTNTANTGGAVTLTGPLRLDANVSINTNNASSTDDGAVTFSSVINADAVGNNRLLTVDAGSSDVTFNDTVGASEALQKLTVSNANNVILNAVTTNSGGATRFNSGVDILASALTLKGDINTVAGNDAGNVSLNIGTNFITLEKPDVIKANSVINIITNGSNTDASITINGNITASVDSAAAESLVLNAGTDANADVLINGDVGLNNAVEAFTITTADTVSIDGVRTRSGGVTIASENSVGLGGNIDTTFSDTNAGIVDITAPIILEANTLIKTDHSTGADAAIVLNEVNGPGSLTLEAGSQHITLNGDMGLSTALLGLTVTSADTTTINGTIRTGVEGVDITSTTAINLNADIDTLAGTNAGFVKFNGPVLVSGTRKINTNHASGTDNLISFSADVNGNTASAVANSLTIEAGTGSVNFAASIGNLSALQFLDVVSASQVDVHGVTTTDLIDIDADLINLNNNLVITTSNGGIKLGTTLAGNVVLNNAVMLNSDGAAGDGDVSINGTVNSAAGENHLLNIKSGGGAVTLLSALGGNAALSQLDISSTGVVSLNSVKTTASGVTGGNGNITVSGSNIGLQGTLDTTDGGVSSNAGSITLAAPVNLQTDTILLTNSVAGTDGSVVITGDITGTATTSLDVSAGLADINFGGNISTIESLKVNSGLSAATTGAVELFNVQTGSNSAGTGIEITASSIKIKDDTFGDSVLSSDLTDNAGSITLNGNVLLQNNLLVDSNALTTDNHIVINGNITADAAANNRLLSFDAGTGTVTVNGIIGNAFNSLSGVTVSNAAFASFDAINVQADGVDITAGSIELGGNINTSYHNGNGAVNLNGVVELASNVTITTYSDLTDTTGSVNFSNMVNSNAIADYDLTVKTGAADITLGANAGGAPTGALGNVALSTTGILNLASIESSGSSVVLNAGVMNLSGNINTGRSSAAGELQIFADTINLLTDVTIDTNSASDQGAYLYATTIDGGGNALRVDTGTSTFNSSASIDNISSLNVIESGFTQLNGASVSGGGSIVISSSDGMNLNNTFSTDSGLITLNSDSDSDGSGTLTLTGTARLQTVDNIISITAPVFNSTAGATIDSGLTAGQVLFNSTGDLSLGAGTSGMQISNDLINGVVASQITLSAENTLSIDGVNTLQDVNLISNVGDISFTGADSSLGRITANTVNNILIGANVSAIRAVDLSANTIISSAPGSISSGTAGITITGQLTGSNTMNLIAETGTVDLQSASIVNLDSLNIDANNLLFAASVPVVTTNDLDLTIRNNTPQYLQSVDLTSTLGQVSITTTNTSLAISSGATITAQTGVNLTANNGDIAVSTVKVTSGAIDISAVNGAVTDNNGALRNLTADKIIIHANSGIGSGDRLETSTAEFDVINNGVGGSEIGIDNTGDVLLTNLVNNGNIKFDNTSNITVDHVDAGYTVGAVEMVIGVAGSVFGVSRDQSYTTIPDITADSAFFSINGNFGTLDRPIVLKLNSEFYLFSYVSSPYFYGGPPPIYTDQSDLKYSVFDSINSVSGQQLIEVESIADIDPAIFTDLHNYSQQDVSIRMPRDQMFDDELETYDRLQ